MAVPHSDNVSMRSVIPFDSLSFFDYSIYTVSFPQDSRLRMGWITYSFKVWEEFKCLPSKGRVENRSTTDIVFRLRAEHAAIFWKSRHLCNDPVGYPELLSHSLRNHTHGLGSSCINVRKGNCYYSLPFSIRMSQSRLNRSQQIQQILCPLQKPRSFRHGALRILNAIHEETHNFPRSILPSRRDASSNSKPKLNPSVFSCHVSEMKRKHSKSEIWVLIVICDDSLQQWKQGQSPVEFVLRSKRFSELPFRE
jgi:hypothetical protein